MLKKNKFITGNNISFSNKKTKRRFYVNKKKIKIYFIKKNKLIKKCNEKKKKYI
ncbi:large ribosomal subunit protein bL28 [Candidatus Nasuia deltocephalinicola]|uniref:large ribosomal subunit protein bL28 n=1 Tax=Candidatus Nasuia deltocephalincola TaxID=1160784 RepID=UPI00216ABCC1|nr:L28 family ribosomal protein [Candidatus Nasuia deltocephalinicola]